ncbi:MAG: hypothetical protein H0V66_10930 [Bdellovibrionales bacterium]|nr:hypothetical protein [Bdellovibrionales bacterium]
MKKLFLSALLFSGLTWANGPQDIVIKSRLDKQSSASLINRLRTFLINNNFGDPYNQTFKTPITVDFNQVLEELPQDTRSWIKDWQEVFKLNVFESVYKIQINNFAYSIKNFSSELKPGKSDQSRIEYVTINEVQGLKLSSSKIAFQIELKKTQSGEPVKFEVGLIGADFIISPELMVEMPMGWQTALLPDSLLMSLHTIDLSRVFAKIIERPELIDFVVKDIALPDVSIRVGNREIKFDKEKIKKFIFSRKEDMKMAILDLLRTRMQERFANIIKDKPQEVFVPRTFSTKGVINTVFAIKTMSANIESRILEAKIDGHFCANENDLQFDLCRTNQLPTKERRKIEIGTFDRSMQEIDGMFNQKRANVAVSISEHYINQLITAAAQAGVLELGSKDFTLGSEKAFVLAEEKGEGFHLYLDIIHKLSPRQRVLVGRSELRFPIRLGVGLKIINHDGFPHLQIKILAVKTDEALLLKGLPQYGLVTNVNTVRFQQKVLKGILEDIAPFNQKILLDLELKEFKDTYLEDLEFFSDGHGRANAVLFMNGQIK